MFCTKACEMMMGMSTVHKIQDENILLIKISVFTTTTAELT